MIISCNNYAVSDLKFHSLAFGFLQQQELRSSGHGIILGSTSLAAAYNNTASDNISAYGYILFKYIELFKRGTAFKCTVTHFKEHRQKHQLFYIPAAELFKHCNAFKCCSIIQRQHSFFHHTIFPFMTIYIRYGKSAVFEKKCCIILGIASACKIQLPEHLTSVLESYAFKSEYFFSVSGSRTACYRDIQFVCNIRLFKKLTYHFKFAADSIVFLRAYTIRKTICPFLCADSTLHFIICCFILSVQIVISAARPCHKYHLRKFGFSALFCKYKSVIGTHCPDS